jgi:fatty-acyl-CoA synthase
MTTSTIPGLMMEQQLLVSTLIVHADRHHGDAQIVSRRCEGDLHRYTYRDCHLRARKLAQALTRLGIEPGMRVGTLAWNGYRHLELYCAVSGMGAVLHTINPRLHPEQLAWMVGHAEDAAVCFDIGMLPLVRAIASHCPGVRHWVMLTDAAAMPPATQELTLSSYEVLLEPESGAYTWPQFGEDAAATLCYTSGTTGNPKGVLYSHRSTILHAYAGALPDALNVSSADCILPVVPMFHVNAWGLPYIAMLVGAKLVFPGPLLDGASIHALMEQENVTYSAGVPTVWLGLLNYLDQHRLKFSTMRRTLVGGSACPPAMMHTFQTRYDVDVTHGWGMTEMSPLGTVGALKGIHRTLSSDAKEAIKAKQGRVLFGVDMRIIDDTGAELCWDGKTSGDLQVRGPWVVREYFRGEGGNPLIDGWFPTGDVACIDADGFMQITDRSKDVIKSGGEWISSIDIENIAVAHPAVAMAACIAMPDAKWDERPLLVVALRPGAAATTAELLAFFAGKVAKWWIPDDVVFVDAIPLGATGKMLKNRLREQFKNHRPVCEARG